MVNSDKKMSSREKRKRRQRIIWGIVTFMLAVGLIGSSIAWGLGSLSQMFFSDSSSSQDSQPSTEDIIKELEAEVKDNPDDLDAHKKLAGAYFQVGEIDKAVDEYEKIIELDPEDIDSLIDLSMVLFLSNNIQDAQKYIEEAIQIDPDYAPVHYNYGLILGFGTKDYDKAIEELEKFIELEKTGSDVDQAKAIIEELKAAKAEAENGQDSSSSDKTQESDESQEQNSSTENK